MIDTPTSISRDISKRLTIYFNIFIATLPKSDCLKAARFLLVFFVTPKRFVRYLSVTRDRFHISFVSPIKEESLLSGVKVLTSILFWLYANRSSLW